MKFFDTFTGIGGFTKGILDIIPNAECVGYSEIDKYAVSIYGRRFKTNGEPTFTLTAQDKHGIYDGIAIRKLTPIECERLQAFPDNWTKEGVNEKGELINISDTQRYKCCGNAVTVNVVK